MSVLGRLLIHDNFYTDRFLHFELPHFSMDILTNTLCMALAANGLLAFFLNVSSLCIFDRVADVLLAGCTVSGQ